MIKTKASYSFEYRDLDGQTESISEYTLPDLLNDIQHTHHSRFLFLFFAEN